MEWISKRKSQNFGCRHIYGHNGNSAAIRFRIHPNLLWKRIQAQSDIVDWYGMAVWRTCESERMRPARTNTKLNQIKQKELFN